MREKPSTMAWNEPGGGKQKDPWTNKQKGSAPPPVPPCILQQNEARVKKGTVL